MTWRAAPWWSQAAPASLEGIRRRADAISDLLRLRLRSRDRVDHSTGAAYRKLGGMTWDRESRGVLELPSGRRIRGRRLSDVTQEAAGWGVHLALRDPDPHGTHRWICWPDFGLPLHPVAAWEVLMEAWERSEHERVEVACRGGRGRTGTALAALAMLDGLDAASAVDLVRGRYDRRAVETPWQRRWLERGPTTPT